MFEFLLSEEKKMRRHAANWLEVAERVYHFRRDVLPAAQVQQLVASSNDLKLRLKEKSDASKLKMAIEKLEDVLRQTGGRIYPTSSIVENVEFFLVAAIVILGLRAYFVQPFKIPTNSMWPSYYGMTHELFKSGEEPGPLARVGRFLAFGATNFSAPSADDGEVYVPVRAQDGFIIYSMVQGRSLGIFPNSQREYFFLTGREVTRLRVPGEFDFERVLEDELGGKNLQAALQDRLKRLGHAPESSIVTISINGREFDQRVYWIPLGKRVKKGEPVISFDIHTGDLLFVDRFTYNFFPPKVGQGFVFKTENIDDPEMKDRNTGEQIRQYYIKRLVGTPGDKIEIRAPSFIRSPDGVSGDPVPQLYRNGQPITGADAFKANSERRGKYPGYTNHGLLALGRVAEIPANSYMALGDNSPRSQDSRFWGFIPEKDVVGKPLFVYYPLSRRWGLAN